MVTRIYTPMIPAYGRKGGSKSVGPKNEDEGGTDPQGFDLGGFSREDKPSQGMATVSEHSKYRKIRMDSILQDFHSTVAALGADSEVQANVSAYLSVVELESRKKSPSIPLMKQTLRSAAGSLDEFVTKALGQPSTVVKDWVDALLLQDVEYRQTSGQAAPGEAGGEARASKLSQASGQASGAASSPEASTLLTDGGNFQASGASVGREEFKRWISRGKEALGKNDYETARQVFEKALGRLGGLERPDLEGRVVSLLARTYDKSGKVEDALILYGEADEKFARAGLPQKQAQVRYAMAGLFEEKNQLDQARQCYEQALELDKALGNTRAVARTLNDLGSVYLREGEAKKASEFLMQAMREASRPEGDKGLLPDIFSNLGGARRALGQYRQAAEAYKISLDHAFRSRDKAGYLATLQNMADLYEEVGKPEKASRIAARMRKLGAA